MAKVRVYELAKEFGVESKVVMAKLQELGEFVRSASSTIEAPVVRKLTDALQGPGGNAGEVRCQARCAPQGGAREARSALPGRCGTSRCPEARRTGSQAGRGRGPEQHPGGALRAVGGPPSGPEARAEGGPGDPGPGRRVLGSGSGPAGSPPSSPRPRVPRVPPRVPVPHPPVRLR